MNREGWMIGDGGTEFVATETIIGDGGSGCIKPNEGWGGNG